MSIYFCFFQDCGCYQHERDKQPLPRRLQHHLHSEETRHGDGQHVREGPDTLPGTYPVSQITHKRRFYFSMLLTTNKSIRRVEAEMIL